MHPTVKAVALVADAIRDCSRRREIVLDLFGGSGTTLIAAATCGRQARLLEYDPIYCDTIIRRWETYTGKQATLVGNGRVFEDVATAPRPVRAEPACSTKANEHPQRRRAKSAMTRRTTATAASRGKIGRPCPTRPSRRSGRR